MSSLAAADVSMPSDGPETKRIKSTAGDARDQFLQVYQGLRAEILADPMLAQKDAVSWMSRMIDYNVPGGKLNRGMAVKDALLAISPNASDELQLKADQVGWAIEFLQAYFLVADDIMDASHTRRGQACWYKMPEVGMVAINDGILLEMLIYCILRRHVRDHPSYHAIVELFLETTHQTAHGQLLDLITAPAGKLDLSKYNMARYMDIVTYKTAFYSFYLPVACGLHLAGITDETTLASAKDILIKMGQYFQVQDDYLDCFADADVLGKIGTDIQDNKCSWLVCQALADANAAQKQNIVDNYGKDNVACINAIKELYRTLKLEDKFKNFEASSYGELCTMIKEQKNVPTAVYDRLLAKIYKRIR